MKKIFIAFLLLIGVMPAFGQSNIAGTLYASNFANWIVVTPTSAPASYSWPSPTFCTVSSAGSTFPAFAVGTPVKLIDADPSKSEVVTPTAVTITGSGCSITISTTYRHSTFHFATATAGLQEAINYANAQNLPALVYATPDWSRLGGTDATFALVKGNSNISIQDARTSVIVPYLWDVPSTTYVARPFSGGGGNIIPTPQYRGYIQPNAGTVAIAGGANWGTDSTKNNIIANAGIVQSQNVANPCVSVDSQGAKGDGTTEDGPAFRAAVALALTNGTKAICLSSKTYKVSDVGGTIQLPGDSGACPSNAVGCTPLSPEPIHMQAYSVSFPSDFRVYGNNAIIEGPGPQPSLSKPMTFVCSDDVTPGSIQPTRNGDPDYVLTYGSCINVQINNLKFNHTFVSFFGPGAVSKSLFEHLSFGSAGILMMMHISDRNVFRDFQDDNSFGGILVGGWWTTRCCYSGTAGYIIESGGYSDVTVINKYVHTQLGALTDADATNLDNWFNDNFYKNANSTNGRALATQPGHNFHGIWGMAYAAYARYQRPSNFGSITNMVLEGTGRQAIFEEGAHNQGYIGNFAFEVMGYCSFLSNVPAGSAGCPDPWGTGNGTIATGSVIYNGGGSMSMNSIAPNDGKSYQNTVWTPDETGLISQQLNSGGSVGLQTYPGSRVACDSGNYTSTTAGGRVGCRFESYGGGIGLNGSTSRDGWVMQAFPASANTGVGPDSLVFYPAPIPQMAQHAYSVKISPSLSLCRTAPTAFDTLPTNCTQLMNNVTGTGTSIVTDIAPTIRTSAAAFFNAVNSSSVNTFQVQDNGNVFVGASQAGELSTSGGTMTVRARVGTLNLDTLNASNTNVKAQGVIGLTVFPSGGVSTAGQGDPGAGNLYVKTNLRIGGVTGAAQCLQADTSGNVAGTGSPCGSGGGGGSGTVSSVGVTNPGAFFSASVANATTTPNISWTLLNASAHSFWGNCSGSTGTPNYCQPSFADITGTATAAQLPLATTGAFGAVKPDGTTITISGGVISAPGGGTMVYPGAGIGNSTGSAWGTSYDATNKIPANFISTLNQSTSGNAATATALASTPTLCSTGQAPTGVLANGNATGCASIGGGGISGLTTGKIPVATSSTAIGNGPLDTTTNAGAVTSSQDIYAPAFHSTDTSGTGFGFGGTEGTAASGSSGVDGFWADSTAHRWSMNNNNAGAVKVVGIGTAGTSGHVPIFSSNGVDIQDVGAAGITASGSTCTITAITNGIITGATCAP